MSLDAREGGLEANSGLAESFYPLFRWLFDEDGEFVAGIEDKLGEARMPDNVEMFVARALAVGVISGFALWFVGTLVGVAVVKLFVTETPTFIGIPLPANVEPIVTALKLPFIVFVSGLVFGSIGFGLGFGTLVSIPYFRANTREREINVLLSDSISFMYALSVGGLNQLEILQAMATADDTYGEVAKEFQSIVLATEYFDTDYRTAIRDQALQTPSDELAQFLTDMLSIINSGGDMTSFLEDQKDKHMRTAQREQEKVLDTLELFGEMYMTLSLFPLLLIIILVIMGMMGNSKTLLLLGTVYGLIPLVGVGFIVLVSTVTQDTVGNGYLRMRSEGSVPEDADPGVLDLGLVNYYQGDYSVFDRIKNREGSYRVMEILRKPHIFFRDNPLFVLGLTVPATILALVAFVLLGWVPLSWDGLKATPVRGTFFWIYVPLYLNFLPLAVFYEWNVRMRHSVLNQLSDDLRKLASANDTGMTLLESIKVVAETSSGRLAREFDTMHAKVNYGTNLKTALVEFNNKYHVPRLARTMKLISEAQEASSQIQSVLSTAAQASENQDEIDLERKSRTRMQVVIIMVTYLTLLGVMALLKVQFLDTMAGLAQQAQGASGGGTGVAGGLGSGIDTELLSMLFFHAVTLQAIISSFIAGYIRDVKILSGMKFAVILPTIALGVWIAVTL
ncbi:MAG: type II secretion system F family protein [Haloarculaceae archaeon]